MTGAVSALARRFASGFHRNRRARQVVASDRFRVETTESPLGPDDYRFKRTLLLVRPDLLDARIGRETLVVSGAARGMTSAVAHALFEMDMYLGDRLQTLNFEDVDMREAIPARSTIRGDLAGRSAFRKLVAQRNAEHGRWGFKIPHAVEYLPELSRVLRDPVMLLCIRNPVGTAKSTLQRSQADAGMLENVMYSSLAWVPALQFLLAQRDVPAVICDMDIVRRRPTAFVRDLKEVFRLEGDEDAIAAALSSRGYKSAAARPGMQFVTGDGAPLD